MTAAEIIGRDILPDNASADCAACKVDSTPRSRRSIEGKLIMLCDDASTCSARVRQGLTPAGYAAMVARGEKP